MDKINLTITEDTFYELIKRMKEAHERGIEDYLYYVNIVLTALDIEVD